MRKHFALSVLVRCHRSAVPLAIASAQEFARLAGVIVRPDAKG